MPGIFDVLAANGILSSLFGQAQAAPAQQAVLDTGDDRQRMQNRQQAILSGQGSVTNPPAPAPVPMMVQAMQDGQVPNTAGQSYDMPDVAQAIQQAQIDPRTIPSARDPFTNTYNAAATAFQNAKDQGGNFLDTLGIKTDRPLARLGNFLMAAGSRDPAGTLVALQQADAEASATRVTPLADGAFSLVQKRGQPPQIVRNDQVAQYLGEREQNRFEQALKKVILGGQVQANTAADKAAIKTGEEARPLLNDVNSMIDRWGQAKTIIEGQGVGAQIQGAFPGIAGFFGGDQVAANKFLEGLTVDETLLNTARTKGAISNQEMNLFKAPIPSTTDDREKVWKPWIEKRIEVLNKLKTFYEGEVARGNAAGNQPTTTQPAPRQNNQGSDISAQVQSAFGAYEPDKYEYRINNGVVQRRMK